MVDVLNNFKLMDAVLKHPGRWDINFVENPKKGSGFTKYDLINLRVVAENNPEAWGKLMAAIKFVNQEIGFNEEVF